MSTGQDTAWDAFLAGQGGGYHTQNSAWAEVKASLGWRSVRVVAERGDHIVGGAQMLYRPMRGIGAVAYVARGPVVAGADAAVGAQVLSQIERTVRELRVRQVTVQPPGETDESPPYIAHRGYLPSDTPVAPRATVLLDVEPDEDEILAAMSSKTRYNIRLSGRRSVTVRDGDAADMSTYHDLLVATGVRQGFTPPPMRYFRHMWDVLEPRGQIRLSVADVDGVPVAAQIAVGFGDTVVNKLSVWSGEAGKHRPNEAVQWATIRWAHAHGYRRYDLEGMELAAAHAVLRDEALPESTSQSVTSYKLGYGGRVVVMPQAQVWSPNPIARWAFGQVYPRIKDVRWFRTMVKRLRTTAAVEQ